MALEERVRSAGRNLEILVVVYAALAPRLKVPLTDSGFFREHMRNFSIAKKNDVIKGIKETTISTPGSRLLSIGQRDEGRQYPGHEFELMSSWKKTKLHLKKDIFVLFLCCSPMVPSEKSRA